MIKGDSSGEWLWYPVRLWLFDVETKSEEEFEFLAAGNVRLGDEEVPVAKCKFKE